MEAPGRRTGPSLIERLLEQPHRYGFFQAVRLLHQLAPGRVSVGRDGPVDREVVRFAAEQSLQFPASEILEIQENSIPADRTDPERGDDSPGVGGDLPPTMVIRFLGATGPQGALPRHYTELVIERIRRNRDRTLAAFLDLLVNHRAASFFYRSWEKYRLYARWQPNLLDDLSVYVFSLFGLGTRGLRDRLGVGVSDGTLLFYSGLIAQRPHSASALESLLGDYFGGIPVRVLQFIGQWIDIEPESRSRLTRFGFNSTLGVDAVVGSRVWVTNARFRVRMGPLTYATFCDLLPSGSASLPALELTRFFVGLEYDFDFQLVLMAKEVPACQLGSTGPLATRLGWSTWLMSGDFGRNADDTILDSQALAAYFAREAQQEAA